MIQVTREEPGKATGVQERERAPEAERILAGRGIWAEAREWGRLWEAEAEEGPFQTEREAKKEGAGKRMAERWWRYSYSYSHVSTMHHAGGAGVGWIMRDTHQAAKTKRAQPRQGLGGCIQSFILRATGKLPLKFFFFEAGESHVEIHSVPSSPVTGHAFCGQEGSQSSTSQNKRWGALCKQSGKEMMTAGTGRGRG